PREVRRMNAPPGADLLRVSEEVREALESRRPVVALESSLIAQGLPAPHNIETANAAEAAVREEGAVPATTAIEAGALLVGAPRPARDPRDAGAAPGSSDRNWHRSAAGLLYRRDRLAAESLRQRAKRGCPAYRPPSFDSRCGIASLRPAAARRARARARQGRALDRGRVGRGSVGKRARRRGDAVRPAAPVRALRRRHGPDQHRPHREQRTN